VASGLRYQGFVPRATVGGVSFFWGFSKILSWPTLNFSSVLIFTIPITSIGYFPQCYGQYETVRGAAKSKRLKVGPRPLQEILLSPCLDLISKAAGSFTTVSLRGLFFRTNQNRYQKPPLQAERFSPSLRPGLGHFAYPSPACKDGNKCRLSPHIFSLIPGPPLSSQFSSF